MAFLKSLFGGKKKAASAVHPRSTLPPDPRAHALLPPPREDATLGDADALQLQAAMARDHWPVIEQVLSAAPDPDRRHFLYGVAVDGDGWPSWLDEWARARPDSSLCFTIRGAKALMWAWEARGGGKADEVTPKGWEGFAERTQRAFEELERARSLDPEDYFPWAQLIVAFIASSAPLEDHRHAFQESVRRSPHNWTAHNYLLMRLLKKWGGSHDEVFSFSREASAQAPRGSRLHELVVDAHAERFLYYRAFEDDSEPAWTYFQRPDVAREVLTAWERRFPGRIGSQPWRDAPALNSFAFCFWQMYDDEKSRRAFEALGPYFRRDPWGWASNESEKIFLKARRQAYGVDS